MKKSVSIIGLLLVLVLLVSACGASEVGIPNNGEPATIRISWWGGDARHEAIIKALDAYMARYPNITVRHEFGAFAGWMDNMVVQLAGRAEPDIMQVNYAWVHAFGSGANVFLDLNTVSNILDLTEWTPEMLQFMTTADGQLGAVPHGMTGRVIIYNRQMLEDHGLTSFPATFDEWIEYGVKVAEGNAPLDQGNNKYAFFPLGQETLDIFLLTVLHNSTGKNLQADGKMLHTVEEVENAFNIFGRFIESNTIPTFEQHEPPFDATNPVWMQGRGGSAHEWVGNIFLSGGNFQENNLDGLGIALLPAVTPGGSQAILQRPSLGHAISRNSAHPEVAAHLLNFLYTDEEALLSIAHQLGVPLSRTAAEIAEREGQIWGLQKDGLELLLAYQGEMCPLFEDPNMRQPRYAIIDAFRSGSINARTAAERYVNEQQAALDNMR